MDTLLRILRPLVVRYCRSRLGGYERVNASPDDVAQEVCVAVLRALPTYQDQGRPFLAFVYGIAQHKVVDAHRAAGRDRSDPVDELPEQQDVHDGPEQFAIAGSDSVEMAALLAELPEKQREVLRLRIVVGLSAEETAEAVGSTAGAVRVAQHRALTKLRELITERGGAPSRSAPEADAAPRRRGGSRGPRRPAHARPDPVPVAAPDWQAAPRTGDIVLDGLLGLADAHVERVVRGATPTRARARSGWPTGPSTSAASTPRTPGWPGPPAASAARRDDPSSSTAVRGTQREAGAGVRAELDPQHLVQLDVVHVEPDLARGHVEPPHPSPSLAGLLDAGVPVLLEVRRPAGERPRVVLAQVLLVADLEAGRVHPRDQLADRQQLAVGEDVAVDERVRGAGVGVGPGDAVVEQPPARRAASSRGTGSTT